MRRITKLLVFFVWFGSLAACGSEDLTRNSMIDRWCGSTPCDWKVEGTVRRVGSWHPSDYAVELVSDDARLSQVNGTVDSDSDCLWFTMIAKVTPGTRVFLELDFLSDGSVDFSQQLPVSDWDKLTFKITPPVSYRGLTFIVRKDGAGKAIVAELAASNGSSGYWDGYDYSPASGCTAPPVQLSGLADGQVCSSDAQCAAGSCKHEHCGDCANDASCAESEVCALGFDGDVPRHLCTARASAPFAALCDRAEQCASGFCVGATCAECAGDSCPDGGRCGRDYFPESLTVVAPLQCDPGQHTRQLGEACLRDEDCGGGLSCLGVELTCAADSCDARSPSCASECKDPRITGGECR